MSQKKSLLFLPLHPDRRGPSSLSVNSMKNSRWWRDVEGTPLEQLYSTLFNKTPKVVFEGGGMRAQQTGTQTLNEAQWVKRARHQHV